MIKNRFTVNYTGKVNLSTNTKGVINTLGTYNSGTRLFMDRLAMIVCGYKADVVPTFIDIVATPSSAVGSGSERSVLVRPLSVRGKVWGTSADPDLKIDELKSAILVNAVISEGDLTTVGGLSNYKMRLLTYDQKIIAEIDDSKDEHVSVKTAVESVSDQVDLLVDWTMYFGSSTITGNT